MTTRSSPDVVARMGKIEMNTEVLEEITGKRLFKTARRKWGLESTRTLRTPVSCGWDVHAIG
jgi:hypothetical protein